MRSYFEFYVEIILYFKGRGFEFFGGVEGLGKVLKK